MIMAHRVALIGAIAALSVCIAFADPVLHETFSSLDAWKVSSNPDFSGEWVVGEGELPYKQEGAQGLIANSQAKKHAIATKFDEVWDVKDKDFVIQFEVRFQNHLECGGAYIKAIENKANDDFEPESFDNATPYSIMFGPDKCSGANDKVHFIFRHKNPISGEVSEHHAQNMPTIKNDRFTHMYTLVVKTDNSFEVLIDGESKAKGNMLSDTDFKPPVNPPATIDDPNDSKPEDWVDSPTIADPDAVKPEDWDEEEPAMIADPNAVKPTEWLDDAPEQIPDPDAVAAEDWDVEVDGEWEAPLIDNPDCEKFGCGEWTAPLIANPAYKGKWSAPSIANPAYKGPWKPAQIPNPNYFEEKEAYNVFPMSGLGFDLWTMQSGIQFSNVYVSNDVDEAAKFVSTIWKAKFDAEKSAFEALQPEVKKTPEEEADASKSEETWSEQETNEDKIQWIKSNIKTNLKKISDNPMPVMATLCAGIIAFLLYWFMSSASPMKEMEIEATKTKETLSKNSLKSAKNEPSEPIVEDGESDEEDESDE